jgi:hypothetical protein
MTESLLNIIVKELQKENLYSENVDLEHVKNLLDKIDPTILDKISSIFPVVIVSHLKNILHDNKIDVSDTPEILELLKTLYSSIAEIRNEKSFVISSKDIVETTIIIVKSVLSLCIKDNKLNFLLKIVEISGSLVLFSLPEQMSLFCKCCK